MTLTLFEALIVTHFVMDWLFQTSWEANNKEKQWLPLFTHCFIYTVGFIPVFLWYGMDLSWLLLIFASHAFFDRRPFEYWWLRTIKRVNKESVPDWLWFQMLIAADQIFHILILVLIVSLH